MYLSRVIPAVTRGLSFLGILSLFVYCCLLSLSSFGDVVITNGRLESLRLYYRDRFTICEKKHLVVNTEECQMLSDLKKSSLDCGGY